MFNFYLSSIGYKKANTAEIEESFIELNDIVNEKSEEEIFLMNEDLYGIQTLDGNFCDVIFSNFSDTQFSQQVLPKLLSSIESRKYSFVDIAEMNRQYQNVYNAFYGAKFDNDETHHIHNKKKYTAFKKEKIWDIQNNDGLWERRELLFERIILCPNVEEDLKKNKGYFSQIKNQLIELNNYCINHWKNGNFNYNDACQKSSLTISPESQSTNNDETLKNLRMFKLPDGRTKYFELHIKSGNLRIHIFPEEFKIYIGYIGHHLPTSTHR